MPMLDATTADEITDDARARSNVTRLAAGQALTGANSAVIFATGFLEHGYRRYIERSLREEFGFEGTPIQISVNIREKKKRK